MVFRPDSGDPVLILTGYTDDEITRQADGSYVVRANGERITDAERKGAVECLWDIFGGTRSSKGFRVLDSHVGLIYGDSITLQRALNILQRLAAKDFASCNVVFGIGSFTYNMLTRDNFGWAMKAIYAQVGDEAVEIYKDPATDNGTKKSARGLLRVEREGDKFVLYERQTEEEANGGALVPVFCDGKMLINQSLAEIRQRLHDSWICPEAGSIVW